MNIQGQVFQVAQQDGILFAGIAANTLSLEHAVQLAVAAMNFAATQPVDSIIVGLASFDEEDDCGEGHQEGQTVDAVSPYGFHVPSIEEEDGEDDE